MREENRREQRRMNKDEKDRTRDINVYDASHLTMLRFTNRKKESEDGTTQLPTRDLNCNEHSSFA